MGFFCTLIPFGYLFYNYGTKLENEGSNPIPREFFLAQAFGYLMYRLLDEMDGKQARKTGNSSPLGLIFDHGCDSLTVGLQGLIGMKISQLGDGPLTFIPVALITLVFYFYTLEEYYVGGLVLPPGNAVSDGSIILIGLFTYMYF